MKMEEKTKCSQVKVEELPFFKKGSLVYAKSGHELELSDKHYRCRQHCKSESGEKQIKKENLEKNFNYMALKLRFDKETGTRMALTLLDDCFKEYIFNAKAIDSKQEILDTTIRSMDLDSKNIGSIRAEDNYRKTGIAKGIGKVKKEDITNFKDYFVALHKELQPLHLFSVLISYIKTLSDPEYSAKIGQGVALISRKIYITNKGTIVKIELERWGWYILNYINRHVPNYLKNIKDNGVIITNDPNDEILKMNVETAIKYFDKDNFMEAMHWFDVGTLYSMFAMSETMLKTLVHGGPEDIKKATMMFMSFLNSNPLAQFTAQIYPAIGKVKIKK
jgi:hypothetical protein